MFSTTTTTTTTVDNVRYIKIRLIRKNKLTAHKPEMLINYNLSSILDSYKLSTAINISDFT